MRYPGQLRCGTDFFIEAFRDCQEGEDAGQCAKRILEDISAPEEKMFVMISSLGIFLRSSECLRIQQENPAAESIMHPACMRMAEYWSAKVDALRKERRYTHDAEASLLQLSILAGEPDDVTRAFRRSDFQLAQIPALVWRAGYQAHHPDAMARIVDVIHEKGLIGRIIDDVSHFAFAADEPGIGARFMSLMERKMPLDFDRASAPVRRRLVSILKGARNEDFAILAPALARSPGIPALLTATHGLHVGTELVARIAEGIVDGTLEARIFSRLQNPVIAGAVRSRRSAEALGVALKADAVARPRRRMPQTAI